MQAQRDAGLHANVLLWAVAQAGARTAAVLADELGAGGFKAAPDDVGRGSARQASYADRTVDNTVGDPTSTISFSHHAKDELLCAAWGANHTTASIGISTINAVDTGAPNHSNCFCLRRPSKGNKHQSETE
jgi:hypothetical protein